MYFLLYPFRLAVASVSGFVGLFVLSDFVMSLFMGVAVYSKLVQLQDSAHPQDSVFIEVAASENEASPIGGGGYPRLKASLDQIQPLLLAVARPIRESWNELNRDMQVASAEVELSLGFEAKGNIFITQGGANANLKIKLVLKPEP